MTAQRIKGQEVAVIILVGGDLQTQLTDIQNFNATMKVRKIEQGYLGETANRYDEIFDGCELDFELHVHSQDWVDYLQAIFDRARRRTPDVTFNVTATMFFPNGDTPVIKFPDIHFGDVPMNISSRGDYVKIKVQAVCSEPQLQKS
jgi:hypothetical protein